MGDNVLTCLEFKMSVGFSKLLRPSSQLLNRTALRTNVPVRHGGNKMNIVPSRWHDLALRAYANIKIGSAKLKPIPEGYVPKEEEYERHPISRWLMKYFFTNGQMLYETKLHSIWEQWNFSHRAMIIAEIRRVMVSEGDYAAWTYRTSDAKYARAVAREAEERHHRAGTYS